MSSHTIEPIGIIHTPYKRFSDGIPIQGLLRPGGVGQVELFDQYVTGLKDLDGFSHIYIIYIFHKSDRVKLVSRPYVDPEERGVFSIRSPHRPNHIGLTVVKLEKIQGNRLEVSGVDMLDGTPLVDIKPYNPHFDSPEHTRIGWLEKYYSGEKNHINDIVDSEKRWTHEDT